jgi:hypothetical protein
MNGEKFMCEATIGFIGVVIGAIIGLIPYFIERKDRYKFEKFKNELMKDLENYKNELERRLEEHKKDLEIKYEVRIKTHQEAFYWLFELSAPLHRHEIEKIVEVAEKAKCWWTKNCFFLDKDTREKFWKLNNMVGMYVKECIGRTGELAAKVYEDTWNLLRETIKSVQDGIKVERLDVLEKPEEKKAG